MQDLGAVKVPKIPPHSQNVKWSAFVQRAQTSAAAAGLSQFAIDLDLGNCGWSAAKHCGVGGARFVKPRSHGSSQSSSPATPSDRLASLVQLMALQLAAAAAQLSPDSPRAPTIVPRPTWLEEDGASSLFEQLLSCSVDFQSMKRWIAGGCSQDPEHSSDGADAQAPALKRLKASLAASSEGGSDTKFREIDDSRARLATVTGRNAAVTSFVRACRNDTVASTSRRSVRALSRVTVTLGPVDAQADSAGGQSSHNEAWTFQLLQDLCSLNVWLGRVARIAEDLGSEHAVSARDLCYFDVLAVRVHSEMGLRLATGPLLGHLRNLEERHSSGMNAPLLLNLPLACRMTFQCQRPHVTAVLKHNQALPDGNKVSKISSAKRELAKSRQHREMHAQSLERESATVLPVRGVRFEVAVPVTMASPESGEQQSNSDSSDTSDEEVDGHDRSKARAREARQRTRERARDRGLFVHNLSRLLKHTQRKCVVFTPADPDDLLLRDSETPADDVVGSNLVLDEDVDVDMAFDEDETSPGPGPQALTDSRYVKIRNFVQQDKSLKVTNLVSGDLVTIT